MFKILTRYKSIIEHYDETLTHEAAHWFYQFLCTHDIVLSHDNPDFLEIEDVENFKREFANAKIPEGIKEEVQAFFDSCMSAHRRLGKIYIDIHE